MTIAVLGTGAVGGMLVSRCDAIAVGTERTVAVIKADGLRRVHDGSTTVTQPTVVERLEQPVSLLVVAVKAYSLEEALERVEPAALQGAIVLPLLNGLEHVAFLRELLASHAGVAEATPEFPVGLRARGVAEATPQVPVRALDRGVASATPLHPPTVVAGSIGSFEAYSPEPGTIVQRSPGATITAASDELRRDVLERALTPLRVPGVEVVVGADERKVLWAKGARLAVLAAATAASGEAVGALRSDPVWRARLEAALGEACAVATADGVALDLAAQWAIVEALPASFVSSTARDVAAGRQSELDAITGSVVRAGERLGVATPALARLLADAGS